MNKERYSELEKDQSLLLSDDEIKEGWHFCPDSDYMLISKNEQESEGCCCESIGNK